MPVRTMDRKSVMITELDSNRLHQIFQSRHYRRTHGILLDSLQSEMARARVVPGFNMPKQVVTMHSTVRLQDLKSGDFETFTLVYPDEADIDNGKLSVLAPLGTALLGARVGRTIRVKVPAGIRLMKVESVLYQPEAAGDFDL